MSDILCPSEPSVTSELVATPPPPPAVPAAGDMVQTVTVLDRAIKQRRDSDVTLINWWLYHLILNPFTLGLFGIYIFFFRRVGRIDSFSERKQAYYRALIEWTERYARQQGQEDEVHHSLDDQRAAIDRAYQGELRPIKAGLSFLLTIVTLGIYGLYVLYRMNAYWWAAETIEQDFDDALSQVWTKLGLMRYPISFSVDNSKRRGYALYLILSIVTIGIWGLVWDYKLHHDPDNLYTSFHSVEDTVLQTVRAH